MTRSRCEALASHLTYETMLPDFSNAAASNSNWAFATRNADSGTAMEPTRMADGAASIAARPAAVTRDQTRIHSSVFLRLIKLTGGASNRDSVRAGQTTNTRSGGGTWRRHLTA